MVDSKLIDLIKEKGYSNINVDEIFDDGQFVQIKFKDEIGSSYIACLREGKLLTII